MKKVLLISLGSIGKRHLCNVRQLLPDAQIAVYKQHIPSDIVPEGANFVFNSLEDAVGFSPDVVINSSPASAHLKTSAPFLKNNIPLFTEKPIAMDVDQAQEFLQLAKASNGFCFVGYILRFQPIFNFLREMIHGDDSLIGEVLSARVEVGQYLPDWRPDSDYREGVSAQKRLGGGVLLELSHELDYASWLFGYPKSLMCSHSKVSDLDIDVEDWASVIYEYDNKRVVVQMDFLQRMANMAMQVVGTKATLYADFIKEEAHIDGKALDVPKLKEGNEMYLRQFDFFFARVFADYSPIFEESKSYEQFASVESSSKIIQIVDAARRSNDEGKRVELDL